MTTPYGGQAGGTFEPAETTIDEGATTARDKANQVKHKISEQARNTVQQARDKAGSAIEERKGELAGSMSSVAGAVRSSTEQLRDEGHDRIAGYAETVAQQFDRAAGYLRDRNGAALRADLEGIARRQPALVIGAAFTLGVLAARFLRSSDRETAIQRYDGNGGYGGMDPAYGSGIGQGYGAGAASPSAGGYGTMGQGGSINPSGDPGTPPAGGGFNATDY